LQVTANPFEIEPPLAYDLDVTRRLVTDLQARYDLTRLLEDAGRIVRSKTLQAQAQLQTTDATLPLVSSSRSVESTSWSC